MTTREVKHAIGSFADVPLEDPQFPQPPAPTPEQTDELIASAAAANHYSPEQVVW